MTVISTSDFIKKYKHVNFQKMARSESCPRVRERLLGIHNLMIGKNRIQAANAVGRNPEWLRDWVLRYEDGGYENLFDNPRPGQKSYLSKKEELELSILILQAQDNKNGGRITGPEINMMIKDKFGVEYKSSGLYDLLERIGLSWVSSRSKHPKSDEKKQQAFKQTFKARMEQIKLKKKSDLKSGFKMN
jgi:transposase